MQCKPVLYIISEALIILVLPSSFSPLSNLPVYPSIIPDAIFFIRILWSLLIRTNISLQIQSSLPCNSIALKNNCICLPGVDQRFKKITSLVKDLTSPSDSRVFAHLCKEIQLELIVNIDVFHEFHWQLTGISCKMVLVRNVYIGHSAKVLFTNPDFFSASLYYSFM